MTTSAKELAFLRNLYLSVDWTERFTHLVDKNVNFPSEGEVLYVNSGAGNHALALRERLNDDVKLSCVCDDAELQKIARAKALAMRADLKFLDSLPAKHKFPFVLANASLVPPENLEDLVNSIASLSSGAVAFFLPTAGSFGEIFSFLWESLLENDLLQHSPEIERLILELPTVSNAEQFARNAKLRMIETKTSNEIFEYSTSEEFLNSILVSKFLLPRWLGFLPEKKREQVAARLAQDISSEHDGLSFRFSVKATLIIGKSSK